MKDQARDTKLRSEMFSLALPLINVVQQWGGAGLFPFVETHVCHSVANINLGVTEGETATEV